MTAAEILAEAALAEGHDVKKTEVAGMRSAAALHLRFGPRVLAANLAGCADLLLGFEAAEGLRWQHMLRPDGLALINRGRLVPPVVELELFEYPDDPIGAVQAAGGGWSPSTPRRWRARSATCASVLVMLGAIADHLPFSADALERCLLQRFAARKPALVELNRRAFAAGRQAAAQAVAGVAAE